MNLRKFFSGGFLVALGSLLPGTGAPARISDSGFRPQLLNLMISHQGMSQNPYYLVTTTSRGVFFKVTSVSPENIMEICSSLRQDMSDLRFNALGDTVADCESARVVKVESREPVAVIEDLIARTGARAWDGFRKRRTRPMVADSGDRYVLFMNFSDGSRVEVSGYNARPEGFLDLLSGVRRIVERELAGAGSR
ncbi:MAG: hypothetical protein IJ523_05030 [Succinivibrionaceae bacterium]|nr:hypothetical protein [Succinivibrionaceae bacterium]